MSETSDILREVREEFRKGDERIEAMFREMEEMNRRHSVEVEEFIASTAARRRASLAFRRELREKIDRLPPAEAA